MPKHRARLSALAFTASLVIHALLLAALPLAIDAATADDDQHHAREPELMVLPVEVALGIDAPTPETPTWLGFEEPKPHIAEHFEIEQPAFVEEPPAAVTPPPEEAVAMEMPPEAEPQSRPVEELEDELQPIEVAAAEPTIESEAAAEPEAPAVEDLAGEHAAGELAEVNPDPLVEPPQFESQESPDFETLADVVREIIEQIEKAMAQAAVESDDETVEPTESPESSETESERQPPTEQPQQPVQPQPQQSPREPGTPADRESPATSVIDVPRDQWQLGRPIAREGLTLKPRRPEFTLLTLLTASPGNPLCEIKFDQHGVPAEAKILRSSGDKRVDDAVLASLYRWRAEGADLSRVVEGRTLDVQIRIILNRRAAALESNNQN